MCVGGEVRGSHRSHCCTSVLHSNHLKSLTDKFSSAFESNRLQRSLSFVSWTLGTIRWQLLRRKRRYTHTLMLLMQLTVWRCYSQECVCVCLFVCSVWQSCTFSQWKKRNNRKLCSTKTWWRPDVVFWSAEAWTGEFGALYWHLLVRGLKRSFKVQPASVLVKLSTCLSFLFDRFFSEGVFLCLWLMSMAFKYFFGLSSWSKSTASLTSSQSLVENRHQSVATNPPMTPHKLLNQPPKRWRWRWWRWDRRSSEWANRLSQNPELTTLVTHVWLQAGWDGDSAYFLPHKCSSGRRCWYRRARKRQVTLFYISSFRCFCICMYESN